MRVLLVEDYAPLAKATAQALREAGYVVDSVTDGLPALEAATSTPYDAIVLDVMLPGLSGFEVLTQLRQRKIAVGVLLLTARDSVEDRVKGLDLGADDYLLKPFAMEEFLARVRSVIRRRYHNVEGIIRIEDLEVNTIGRTVKRAGVPIDLSGREYSLLEYLAVRRGQIVTRAELLEHVYTEKPESNVVDVFIASLRKKIDGESSVKLIHTRRRQGYVLGSAE